MKATKAEKLMEQTMFVEEIERLVSLNREFLEQDKATIADYLFDEVDFDSSDERNSEIIDRVVNNLLNHYFCIGGRLRDAIESAGRHLDCLDVLRSFEYHIEEGSYK